MIRRECSREPDLLDAIVSHRWPERCDEELRSHVSGCAICTDVAVVAPAIQEDFTAAWEKVSVPDASLVWWRSELRARQHAVQVATRPLTVIEALAGAAVMVIAIALLSRLDTGSLSTFILANALPLSLGVGFFVVFTPIALYFLLSDE